jgi:hypothetical protein
MIPQGLKEQFHRNRERSTMAKTHNTLLCGVKGTGHEISYGHFLKSLFYLSPPVMTVCKFGTVSKFAEIFAN